MRATLLSLTLLFVCFASPAFGQKFLQKPYTEWSVDEVKKLLNEAPWSNQYQSESGLQASALEQGAREQADNRLSGSDRGNMGRGNVPAPVIIQLYSALPLRQALVRSRQIGAKYEKLNADDKAKFDASTAGMLECKLCKDYYIITLTKTKDKSERIDDGIFQTLTLENLKGKIWLANDKEEKLDLFQFTPPKGAGESAVFFFKRNKEDGKPFFSEADKEIKFLFANELRAPNNNAYAILIPRSFDFKVAKMIVDGKLAF
ncbi:MAG TPA: hypothetical protein VJV05_01125 [Pyrinomonadaceae bacterium]|nr:hypothetical protein [Pyrinomonadaceae bacterium]